MPRKPSHSREEFVSAALAHVDAHGASNLTARSLGEAVGVDPMALYRYFSGMDELAAWIVDRLFADALAAGLPEGSPRERLVAHLMNVRRVFAQHPNTLALLLSGRGDQPNGDAITRIGFELLRGIGLSGRELLVCAQMLESYTIGVNVFDLAGSPHHLEGRRQRRRRLDDPEVDRWNRSAKVVGAINDDAFRLGLEALVDRCVQIAHSPSKAPSARGTKRSAPAD